MRAMDTPRLAAVAAAALAGALAAVAVARTAPAPAADVARGTEEAFARGLHAREIPPGAKPHRWTLERTVVSFRHLPAGPAVVDVQVRGHRGPVVVVADGVVLGTLDAGARAASFEVPAGTYPVRAIELRSETFAAGDGRRLGALFERVSVRAGPARWPALALLALFVLPAAITAGMAMLAGGRPWVAGALGSLIAAMQASILWPSGVVHSPYATRLAVLLCGASIASGAWGAFWARRRAGAGVWAFTALLAAVVVQLVIGTSPLMVVSDAVFHANNLARVSAGDLFLTSLTQHAPPFRFPYGVSYYVVLVPLLRAGLDPVALVRWGAGLAGVAAAAGLFGLLARRGPARAALAVALWQLMPGTIDVLSFGNLSNAFAQGMTVLFFAWWAGRARGSWATGAALLAVAATAHLSGFVVLAVLGPWLAWAHWPELKHDRTRAVAMIVGLVAAALYFGSFAGLVVEQLSRLREGGGPAAQGPLAALVRQLWSLARQWGLPVLALALLGRPRPASDRLDRDLTAWWGAGVVLLGLAVATPLDVRWVYALAPAAAIAAAIGFARCWTGGPMGRLAGLTLLAVQAGLWAWSAADALWSRYR
jgi:hypothetical protein